MKITGMTLALFARDDIPTTSYGRHTGEFKGSSESGLGTKLDFYLIVWKEISEEKQPPWLRRPLRP